MRGFWIAALWLSVALPARADTFVIAPPWYQGTDGRTLAARISEIVRRDLAVQRNQAIPPSEALKQVPAEQRVACAGGACAERYREAHGAVAAILIRIYRTRGGRGPATSFQLGIQPQPGLEYRRGAVLEPDTDLAKVVPRVLREAMRAYRRGPGPWLAVSGAPRGAKIFVDDAPMGTVPSLLPVGVGAHRVRVEAHGFEPMTQLVSLPSPTTSAELEFRLEPARVTAPALGAARLGGHGAGSRPASPGLARGLIGTGSALLALGLASTGVALFEYARSDGCDEQARALGCAEHHNFGENSWLRLGVGLSLVGLGAGALTSGLLLRSGAAKLEVAAGAGSGGAALQISGTF